MARWDVKLSCQSSISSNRQLQKMSQICLFMTSINERPSVSKSQNALQVDALQVTPDGSISSISKGCKYSTIRLINLSLLQAFALSRKFFA